MLVGEIEEGCEHSSRQLDGHSIDPIEGLSGRQTIENLDHPLTDQRLEHLQVSRRRHGLNHLRWASCLGPSIVMNPPSSGKSGAGSLRKMLRADE